MYLLDRLDKLFILSERPDLSWRRISTSFQAAEICSFTVEKKIDKSYCSTDSYHHYNPPSMLT